MSFLVELPEYAYDAHAFEDFIIDSKFRIGTARAMMWMSQLAYEVRGAHEKVEPVLGKWRLCPIALVANETTAVQRTSTRGLIAGGHGVTIVAFAGTDPLAFANWITNFNLGSRTKELHQGFEAAVASVWDQVIGALENRPQADLPLFIVGHSLGGALAVIAAERLVREARVDVTGVYTFGMPRAANSDFVDAYNRSGLGNVTYRLVHGLDIVPTVPPPFLGFRHVGRMLACERGERFSSEAPLSSIDSNDPPFVATLKSGYIQRLRDVMTWNFLPSYRPGWLGTLQRLLSPPFGDHLPDRYRHALEGD